VNGSNRRWVIALPAVLAALHSIFFWIALKPGITGESLLGYSFIPHSWVLTICFVLPVYPAYILVGSTLAKTSALFVPALFTVTAGLWIIYGFLIGRRLDGRSVLIKNRALRIGALIAYVIGNVVLILATSTIS